MVSVEAAVRRQSALSLHTCASSHFPVPRCRARRDAEFVAKQGPAGVRHEEIVAAVKPAARAKVPDHLKAELLKRIRNVLEG